MRLLQLIFLLTILSLSGNAQSFLRQSTVLEKDKTNRTYSLIHYDSSRFAVMRMDKRFRLAETEVYNNELKHLNTFQTTDKKRRYGGLINIRGKMYMLYSYFKDNPIKKTYEEVSLYALPVSTDSFKVGKDSIALIEPFEMESKLYRGNFVLSPDHSKLLVYDFEEDGDIDGIRGLTNTINIRIFDTDFNLLWKRKVNLAPNPSGKRVIAIKKLRISNQGVVAILSDYFRDQRSYSLKTVTADPTLFFIGEDPADFMRFKPNLGDRFYNEVDFKFDTAGNIIWFGFYSNKKYYKQAGSFYIKINAERSKVLQKKIQPFEPELLQSLLNKKRLPKKLPEIRNFKLIHFRITSSGDLIVSAEQQPYGVNNFKSHDLLIMRFNPEGELKWSKHIDNFNSFPDQFKVFLSHYMYLDGDNTYLIFNRGIYKGQGKAVAIQLDANGKTKERTIFEYARQNEVICPEISYPLPSGKVFLSLQSPYFKYYRFGILDFRKMFEE